MHELATKFREKRVNLMLPRRYDDDIQSLVRQRAIENENVEQRPFSRQIDFWAFSIVTAIALGLEPWSERGEGWGKTFLTSTQDTFDEDLSLLVTVIAVAKFGSQSSDALDVSKIIDLANRLAVAGCTEIFQRLNKQSAVRATVLHRLLQLTREFRQNRES